MRIFPAIAGTLLVSMFFLQAHSDAIGGIPVEEWNMKCKRHFDKYGNRAAEMPIRIIGYCERYMCQKYGTAMYGVQVEQCRTILNKDSNCRYMISDAEAPYPKCCPRIECDRRKKPVQ